MRVFRSVREAARVDLVSRRATAFATYAQTYCYAKMVLVENQSHVCLARRYGSTCSARINE